MDAWPLDGPILLHARAYLIKRKKIAWKRDRQIPVQTLRLLDQIGPVGRFDENTQFTCFFKSLFTLHNQAFKRFCGYLNFQMKSEH